MYLISIVQGIVWLTGLLNMQPNHPLYTNNQAKSAAVKDSQNTVKRREETTTTVSVASVVQVPRITASEAKFESKSTASAAATAEAEGAAAGALASGDETFEVESEEVSPRSLGGSMTRASLSSTPLGSARSQKGQRAEGAAEAVVLVDDPEEFASAVFDTMIEQSLGEEQDPVAFKQELLARLQAELDANYPEGVTEAQLMDIIQDLLHVIETEQVGDAQL